MRGPRSAPLKDWVYTRDNMVLKRPLEPMKTKPRDLEVSGCFRLPPSCLHFGPRPTSPGNLVRTLPPPRPLLPGYRPLEVNTTDNRDLLNITPSQRRLRSVKNVSTSSTSPARLSAPTSPTAYQYPLHVCRPGLHASLFPHTS